MARAVFTGKVPNFLVFCFLQENQLNVQMLLERVEALEAKQKPSIADMKWSTVQYMCSEAKSRLRQIQSVRDDRKSKTHCR